MKRKLLSLGVVFMMVFSFTGFSYAEDEIVEDNQQTEVVQEDSHDEPQVQENSSEPSVVESAPTVQESSNVEEFTEEKATTDEEEVVENQNDDESEKPKEESDEELKEEPVELTEVAHKVVSEDCDFTVDYEDEEYEVSFEDNKLTVKGNGNSQITIHMKEGKESTSQRIEFVEQAVVILDSVNIVINNMPGISVKGAVDLIIDGDVTVKGSTGIEVNAGSSIYITGKNDNDSLTAIGTGTSGTGIGSKGSGTNENESGKIFIEKIDKLTAIGSSSGQGGVGIGGGHNKTEDAGIIIIKDVNELFAQGGKRGAGIGSSAHSSAEIYIENVDKLTAIGGEQGAAIGTGRNTANYDNQFDTNITIVHSNVEATGGKYGAGIGSGYTDESYGDYSRISSKGTPGIDFNNKDVNISIIDSNIVATGGTDAAAIGSGYKEYAPNIYINENSNVIAYAGKAESGSSKVPTAIGSGSDGSGIFSDNNGSIKIENGANVVAFGYGYDAPTGTGNKAFLNNKWAISRDLDDSETTAYIFNGRLLTPNGLSENGNFFNEELFDEENPEENQLISVYTKGNNIIAFENLVTGEVIEIPIKDVYSSFAITLKEGAYKVTVNGSEDVWSSLEDEGYQAVTNGEVTGKSGLIYGQEEVNDGSYETYNTTYNPYGSSSDSVNIKYAFGKPSATFIVEKGVNNYDALAKRYGIESVVPEIPEEPVVPTVPVIPVNPPVVPDTPDDPVVPDAPEIDEPEITEPQDEPKDPVTPVVEEPTDEVVDIIPAVVDNTNTVVRVVRSIVTPVTNTVEELLGRGDDIEPVEENIGDNDEPLASNDTSGAWALINLIAMLCGLILSFLLFIFAIWNKRKEDEDEDEEAKIKNKMGWRIATAIVAIISAIVFFLTEDMNLPMIWWDKWSLLMIIFFVLNCVGTFLSKHKEVEENE